MLNLLPHRPPGYPSRSAAEQWGVGLTSFYADASKDRVLLLPSLDNIALSKKTLLDPVFHLANALPTVTDHSVTQSYVNLDWLFNIAGQKATLQNCVKNLGNSS